MRFGVKTRPEHVTWQQMRDLWSVADEIPLFESAWNWDHFYPLTGDLDGPNLEAWTSLAALAQATRRIRIGVQVTGMIYRHPAVLANMAATVDIISEGRLDLGLGAGWNQLECDAYGIALPPLKERFDRFDEGVQIVIGLLSQEHTDFAGKYHTLTRARCEPKPVQRPHPPIVIGGRGPKRTLPAAAKWAQHWNVIAHSPDEWLSLKQILLDHCTSVGRDPAEIDCSVNVAVPPDGDLGPAVELAAAYGDAGVDIAIMNLPNGAPPSLLERLATSLEALR
ncbi:LLM class F420-dependent oxidoreductase [Nonomuraea sp. NPDC046802]|uniref:LLM class F420-dependent oxidoreductase n=1 Tax=Nonomuraea sp. NPDC046802 TaxID=3154919 RepID=UPI0034019E7F